MNKQMNVVSILDFSGDVVARASGLTAATGVSLAEARNRAQGPGPRVVAVHADRAQAEQMARALAAHGLDPCVLSREEIESEETSRITARSFQLLPAALRVEARDGRALEIPFAAVRLLLRGTAYVRETHTETTTETKMSLSRAVVTGGLVLTKNERKTTTTVQEKTEAFLHVFAPPHPTAVLRETELLYQGLGPAMQPTRTGNFVALQRELRSRAAAAAFDDRLVSRAGQTHLLGGALAPERYLDVAIMLIARAFGGK